MEITKMLGSFKIRKLQKQMDKAIYASLGFKPDGTRIISGNPNSLYGEYVREQCCLESEKIETIHVEPGKRILCEGAPSVLTEPIITPLSEISFTAEQKEKVGLVKEKFRPKFADLKAKYGRS